MKQIVINPFKKTLIFGLLIILIITNLAAITNGHCISLDQSESVDIEISEIYTTKEITVDDDDVADFDNICDALDNATSGDTIIVYSGTYRELVKIYESITIIGVERNDGGQPIIDACGKYSAITVWANGCTVRGFYCKNGTSTNDAGIKLYSDNNIIENNTVENCYDGIALLISSHNIISNNTVFSTTSRGIHLIEGSNNSVFDNNISRCNYGIGLWHYSDCNIISRNTLMFVDEQAIWVELQSNENVFSENNILNNNWGMWFGALANYNTIEHNNFIGNNLSATFWHSFHNRWNENYWGRPKFLPKIIVGTIGPLGGFVFWVNFDRHPLRNPYET